MKIVITLMALVMASLTACNSTQHAHHHAHNHGDHHASIWDDYVHNYEASGMFGRWISEDVTEDMWVGIPAGLKYTQVSENMLSPDGTRIIDSYIMSTEEGHVISAGASITYYDTNLNKILKSTSGFDMGKPYNGTSVLLSRDENSESWEYTEHSQGQTTTYAGTTRMINNDTMENSVRRKDGTGVTDTGTRTRQN